MKVLTPFNFHHMLTPSLLIVTDRGGLKAYKVEPNAANPGRGPALHQIDSYHAQDAHGRYEDKVTDRAGRFQGAQAAGRHIGGSDEHGTIDIENDRRACKHVAERINEIVKREKPESWFLAVPSTIHRLLTDHLDKDVLTYLTDTAHADLLRVEPSKLASHFPALQPA